MQCCADSAPPPCTGMTNWQNTIQCLGSDNMMSLGIETFATEGAGTKSFFEDLLPVFLTCPELERTF